MEPGKFPRIMKSAAIAATCATLLLLCCPYRQSGWWLPCTVTFATTAYHFVMRLAVGYLLLRLTNYDFDYRHVWFQPRSWESALYRLLNIRKWKRWLPTYAPSQFSLTEQSLHRVIQNMCGAELVHEIIMVLSMLPIIFIPVLGGADALIITSVLAMLFDSLYRFTKRS